MLSGTRSRTLHGQGVAVRRGRLAMRELLGKTLGDFEIFRELGGGGICLPCQWASRRYFCRGTTEAQRIPPYRRRKLLAFCPIANGIAARVHSVLMDR